MTAESNEPRRARIGLVVALAAALALLCCGGGSAAFFLDGLNGSTTSQAFGADCGKKGLVVDPNHTFDRIGSLDDAQMRNAATIIAVGQKMNVPPRGWVIAIATALQESVLTNLGYLGARNDHDSLGLFQQRPSQGWGSPEQIMDPQYSSRKFYEHLVAIHDWDKMRLTDAAQAVQRSAYPDAYAKHESLAASIVNKLADGAARAAGSLVNLRCVFPGEISASGWTVPVSAHIVSGFRTPDRPSHFGVDLAVAKGTEVHAASAGVVITAECNAHTSNGGPWSCNIDGSTAIGGCGWYVEILHAGNVITRYCHMVRRPEVTVGQTVTAGQLIGYSGSSGNSSGPHLHFEVHLNGDSSNNGAIDPVPFMQQMGVPLGVTAPSGAPSP
ncbi:M23 family metallopeptidase [Planosporangium thailandense]|uniref:M23 family metallopeptidase n=1 Tax=Planosporangium thailandense TaxID=765197 RepID=A0ABX0XT87_9ACTN|nr:M23 family metallopeptidase [Planosporangium thailandense]NJC69193.1 M23 family metallopeptidase [Planosporangium thailandense]